MKLLNMIFIMICVASFVFGQSGTEGINKAYPDWKTNFEKKSINLEELISGGPPKDGIPAIFFPKFEEFGSASEWLNDREPVISVDINNEAKAYPLSILIWHEIANDTVGGIPVLVSFCPLCYSALVFNRRISGMAPFFGVSGLLRNSDMVMYDDVTESFWQQFTGEAIVGEMTGKTLELIPTQIISYKQFKDAYPLGTVLSKDTGFDRKYGKNPYVGYDDIDQSPFLYKGEKDNRLPPNEKVIAIKVEGIIKAYPYSITWQKRVIHDNVNDMPLVVFHSEGAASALDESVIAESKDVGSTGVFSPIVDNQNLTFTYKDGYFFDDKTNSAWDITGKCIAGKFNGKRLERIKHGDYFAFAWFAFRPETEVYIEIE